MDDLAHLLTLLMVPGVGPTRFRQLVERFGSARAALDVSLHDLKAMPRMDESTASAIRTYRDEREVRRQLTAMERHGVRVVSLWDEAYPELLKEIEDPPPVLFVLGGVEAWSPPLVAVVGTRVATSYGRRIAEQITGELVERGIGVVSGMARGIDAVSHRVTLARGGRTVAVLGCGVDVVYPPEHRTLRDDIVQHGAVVSEFLMGTEPDAPHFPRRNRIISGMSLGTLVVEAGEKSGALLTAAYALDQNREVFAVPGNIVSPRSQGTNALIKRGAKLVSDVEDILEELRGPFRPLIASMEAPRPIPKGLPQEEEALLHALSSEPRHIDGISEDLGRPPSEVLTVLLSLELSGLVRQLPGKMFVRM